MLATEEMPIFVAEPAAGEPRLVPQGAMAHLPTVPVRGTACLIGSREGVNIRLRSRSVSALHAILVNDAGQVIVRDLSSTKHIYVNGRQTREAILNSDDQLTIGKITFQFVPGDQSDSSSPVVRSAPSAKLWFGEGQVFPILGATVVIGRRRGADIVVRNRDVAPAQCILYTIGSQWHLSDLGGPTPTLVNERAVQHTEVHDGDVIGIAGEQFQLQLASMQAPVRQVQPKAPPAITAAAVLDEPHAPAAIAVVESPPDLPDIGEVTGDTTQVTVKLDDDASRIGSVECAVEPPPTPAQPPPIIPTVDDPVTQQKKTRSDDPLPPPSSPSATTSVSTTKLERDRLSELRRWGPLAMALAVSDRPKSPPSGSQPTPDIEAASTPLRHRTRRAIAVVAMLIVLLGAFTWAYSRFLARPS